MAALPRFIVEKSNCHRSLGQLPFSAAVTEAETVDRDRWPGRLDVDRMGSQGSNAVGMR